MAEELVIASLEDDECALADTDGESLPCGVVTNVAPLIIERREAQGKVHWRVALCVQEDLGADALRVLLARMGGALWASQPRQPGTCVLDGVVVMVPSCATAHSTVCAAMSTDVRRGEYRAPFMRTLTHGSIEEAVVKEQLAVRWWRTARRVTQERQCSEP